MYVAVKGGDKAIENSLRYLADIRRGDRRVPELSIAQIREQLPLAVDRVMTEGSLHDPDLAALAIKQANGDIQEAVFLLRAYRTTLPRFGASLPIDTAKMQIRRRISATYKDLPGGQILGPSFDYTHRLLDFTLAANGETVEAPKSDEPVPEGMPRVADILDHEGLIELEIPDDEDGAVPDLTRESMSFPADRATRLQNLARGDEGFLLALG
jgi:alpha-D-ribose 1-methylphosphonate 5-triphosphate synthase subunit PhnI